MGKKMNQDEMKTFVNKLSRAELHSNVAVYTKAVRVTLIALGYDEDWVNEEFREYLENEYDYAFE